MKTHNPTPRELEVAELTAFGATEKEISCYMCLSVETIKAHKKNFNNKTGCRNIADMTRWYLESQSGIHFEPTRKIAAFATALMLSLIAIMEITGDECLRPRNNLISRAKAKTTAKATIRIRPARREYQLLTA